MGPQTKELHFTLPNSCWTEAHGERGFDWIGKTFLLSGSLGLQQRSTQAVHSIINNAVNR